MDQRAENLIIIKSCIIFKEGDGAKAYPAGSEVAVGGLGKLTLLASKKALIANSPEGKAYKAAKEKK